MNQSYDYEKIREEVRKIVKDASYSENNSFGDTVWVYHILPVVKHSLMLGEMKNADLEVLELAALFHDYACLVDAELYKEHHIHSGDLAQKILQKYDFPQGKIDAIKACIYGHRGSVQEKRETIEAQILASADAMSHISELADLFYLAFNVHRYKTLEGCKWLKGKFNRSWNKVMPEGKEIIQEDYELAMKILDRAINRNN